MHESKVGLSSSIAASAVGGGKKKKPDEDPSFPAAGRALSITESRVAMRSRHEELEAVNIMHRSNTWEKGRYLTRERQQQEKVHHFQKLHQQLKHSPLQLYQEDVASEKDYLMSPEYTMKMYKTKKVDLSASDPSPEMVNKIREHVLNVRRQRAELTDELGSGRGPKTITVAEAGRGSSVPKQGSVSATELRHGSIVTDSPNKDPAFITEPPHVGGDRPEEAFERPPSDQLMRSKKDKDKAPTRIVASPEFASSTLALLHQTKGEVADQVKSVAEYGLYIPGPIELKRTITKIFANPKHAERISQDEYERRQKLYEEEKRRLQHQQVSQLAKEREVLQAEIDRFSH
eukprot:NODE_2120_length_1201_cov_46.960938_g1758_i0.p1 GENE.NODE_2120_length_1201_cov_46.960938_g1758_i0~~NODE_2120_length_1201_cov_46.960938_g1758_i0.p1  ORF type:complete len:346 (+),score=84.93 NODE_2120_length_1201_cov_46.960938_g1758_i0:43-1080(+)